MMHPSFAREQILRSLIKIWNKMVPWRTPLYLPSSLMLPPSLNSFVISLLAGFLLSACTDLLHPNREFASRSPPCRRMPAAHWDCTQTFHIQQKQSSLRASFALAFWLRTQLRLWALVLVSWIVCRLPLSHCQSSFHRLVIGLPSVEERWC